MFLRTLVLILLILHVADTGLVLYVACTIACYGAVATTATVVIAGIGLIALLGAGATGAAAGAVGGASVCAAACAPFMFVPSP
ncbi:unnamed protein product [Rotaria socialis]|nr:unnamed protein product [Rotaria socialis]CAF4770433.1 unnamed protein product [Rotaria socialis]